jgi:hypothetical protein
MIGRYPDYDVLETTGTWDDRTKEVVLARLKPPGPLRFFGPEEEPTLRAFCDIAVGQDDEPRVPVAEAIDAKLAGGQLDGYIYAGMPDDRDTWRGVLRGLDEVARGQGVDSFSALNHDAQVETVSRLANGDLSSGVWDSLNPKRAWSVCMRAILSAFYSHPWAWNEIGFGGPAYPRGFMRMGQLSALEPFERPGATGEDPVAVADELET